MTPRPDGPPRRQVATPSHPNLASVDRRDALAPADGRRSDASRLAAVGEVLDDHTLDQDWCYTCKAMFHYPARAAHHVKVAALIDAIYREGK